MIFSTVNQHCLSNLSKLAETRSIVAADDIVDARGIKLWAKGNTVNQDLTEKLLRRKLSKPLEASLTVDGALSMADIIDACRQHLEKHPQLGLIAGKDALKLLDQFRTFPLPEPMRLLLTTAQHSEIVTYQHTLGTLLISAGLATLLHTSDHDARNLILATLLHDMGEIYINPDYLKQSHRLAPEEWKHIASHPRIGQLLLEELTMLPASIGQCIAHHHERLNGSGYPMQLDRQRHHPLANLLAIADTLTPILTDGDNGAPLRAALALRVVPEEFDSVAVAAVTQALRKGDSGMHSPKMRCTACGTARTTWARLEQALRLARTLAESANRDFVKKTAQAVHTLLNTFDRALRATGVIELTSQLGEEEYDAELILEICQIEKELLWRLRHLARCIHLRADQQSEQQSLTELAPLITMLDATMDSAPA